MLAHAASAVVIFPRQFQASSSWMRMNDCFNEKHRMRCGVENEGPRRYLKVGLADRPVK
jgi:hypothetical protein